VRLEERDSPLQVAWPEFQPRATTSLRQFRRMKSTRRPPTTGSLPDQFQTPRRVLQGTFQTLFQPLLSNPCILFFYFVRVSFSFGKKWLLPALCFPSLEPPPSVLQKLNWKNYLPWSASVELWFLGQGYHDHLEKGVGAVPNDKKSEWEKLDFQLCVVL